MTATRTPSSDIDFEQAVRKLREIAEHSWEEYKSNEALRDRAERNLQVAAQTCIDIANHIIAVRRKNSNLRP